MIITEVKSVRSKVAIGAYELTGLADLHMMDIFIILR